MEKEPKGLNSTIESSEQLANKKEGDKGGPEGSKKERLLLSQMLSETAERFNTLEREGRAELLKKDSKGQEQKLKERAQLLVELPGRLSGALEGLDQDTKEEVLDELSQFAASAQAALESGEIFNLMILLNPKGKGSKIGDKNILEKMIDDLKRRGF